MKLVILDETLITRNVLPLKLKRDGFDCEVYSFTTPEELLPRIKDAFAIFTNRISISREVMEKCPNLKYIGIFATGYNLIDIVAAKELNITVCNVPDYSSYSVSQHALALLLEIVNRVSDFNNIVKNGNWADENIIKVPTYELYNKTLGIIGYGSIGKTFGEMAKAMGMKLIAYRNNPNPDDNVRYVDLDTIYKESDVISIHCPLNDKTRKMINASALEKMKDGVILINTARGAILDEEAVSEALNSGKLYMAGIDVMDPEPPKSDNPLLNNPRSIITPHSAWATLEARKRLIDVVAENFNAFLDGHPKNVVNP